MKRALAILAGLAVLGLAVFLAIFFWPAPAARAVAATAPSPQLIARGAYLATAADCVACHTTENGAPYAGGRPFVLPFGTIYAPNITPDRATGIGAWSDGEFIRAMRHGVGRNGEQLYPAFPYTAYSKMPDADMLAVKAYLFRLQPVRNEVRENGLSFPFNQRPLMKFWNILFHRSSEPLRPDPQQTAEWNRGRYLVTSLGHCGECHTPRNLLYGYSGKALSGETMQGWTAWNITSDRAHGVGAWSEADLVSYFRYGYAPGRGVASGPMKEAVDYSLSKLTDADLRAMAVYLKTTDPAAKGPRPVAPATLTRASVAAPAPGEADSLGRQIFEGACASCHAWNGQGQQSPLAALRGRRSVADPKGLNVVQTILRGGNLSTPQGHAFMPAFAQAYSDREIAAVANYVVAHFGGDEGQVSAKDVATARRQ
ncbi:cytochrome c [Phenylobacterium deserti]|uniref:Cytochrome c n=1 Tax=Phenylobacterium deserti TaxID=1914756 RepID=A0A328AN83_9CAUL|nr:cytochrome c [Phenylobacterium deserti]RAK56462.1 cytochrome c [Phenylobacterium deserti]